jgi:hypothetical protein
MFKSKKKEKTPLFTEEGLVDLYNEESKDSNKDSVYKFPFKYEEGDILDEIRGYVESTYNEYYVGLGLSDRKDGDKTQVMDLLFANQPTALEFSRGAVIKYVTRYGKKLGYNRLDLLKAAHYILFMLKSDSDMKRAACQKENS